MDSDNIASDELWELVFAAIDHGLDQVRGGIALVPFALSRGGEKRTLTRFEAESPALAVAGGRKQLAALGPAIDFYALAFDGFVTYEGVQFDAIIVEAGERGREIGLRFAQRYRPSVEGATVETVGNPLLIDAPPLWLDNGQ